MKLFSDFLASFPDMVREPKEYVVTCPAHDDGHPSLACSLKPDGSLLMVCRAGCGNDAVLAALGKGREFFYGWEPGDAETVARDKARPVAREHVAALAGFVAETAEHLAGSHPEVSAARCYIVARFDLPGERIEALTLGLSTPDLGSPFPYVSSRFCAVPRLTVPMRGFDGVVRGMQGRDLTGTDKAKWCSLLAPDGEAWARFGVLSAGNPSRTTVITEGPSDGLTAVAAGYDSVFVVGASHASDDDMAEELAANLRDRAVYVCGDNDEAGRTFAHTLARALVARGISARVVIPPEDGEDLNAWSLRDSGFGSAFLLALSAALPPQAVEVSESPDMIGTDLQNADRLIRKLGGLIRYAKGLGFYIWSGRGWARDDEDRVRTEAQTVWQDLHAEMQAAEARAALIADADKDAKAGANARVSTLRKAVRNAQMSGGITNLIRELAARPGMRVSSEHFDQDPELLAFRNGTVNLRTGVLQPHNPDDMITRVLDIDYVPTATCPRWEQFLGEVFPADPEMPGYLRTLIGYGITGHTTEQCLAVFWGEGANGKSVFLDTLTEVFRQHVTTTPFSTFERKPSGSISNDVAALHGARLVMASEGERDRAMDESTLKRVTGQDIMTARFLHKEYFEFRPQCLILLATNHKPAFKGQDDGIWRRVKLVPWQRTFTEGEQDKNLKDKLRAEAEGIAAWAVRGAADWHRLGLTDPETTASATREYRETSDVLYGFFPGVIEPAEGEELPAPDAYRAYLDWCEAEGLKERDRMGRNHLYREMENRKVKRSRKNIGIVLHGVRFADSASPFGTSIK